MKYFNNKFILICGLSFVASITFETTVANAQILDQIFNPRPQYPVENNGEQQQQQQQQPQQTDGIFRSRLRDLMTVNVPIFYDMVKSGNSMGLNVLSGMVRVDKGAEAERSGLQGPRPLSVRIFGVPVYERGQRVRDSPGTTGIQQPPPPQPSSPEANEIYRPESTKDESSTKESEEMPSIPK